MESSTIINLMLSIPVVLIWSAPILAAIFVAYRVAEQRIARRRS